MLVQKEITHEVNGCVRPALVRQAVDWSGSWTVEQASLVLGQQPSRTRPHAGTRIRKTKKKHQKWMFPEGLPIGTRPNCELGQGSRCIVVIFGLLVLLDTVSAHRWESSTVAPHFAHTNTHHCCGLHSDKTTSGSCHWDRDPRSHYLSAPDRDAGTSNHSELLACGSAGRMSIILVAQTLVPVANQGRMSSTATAGRPLLLSLHASM